MSPSGEPGRRPRSAGQNAGEASETTTVCCHSGHTSPTESDAKTRVTNRRLVEQIGRDSLGLRHREVSVSGYGCSLRHSTDLLNHAS